MYTPYIDKNQCTLLLSNLFSHGEARINTPVVYLKIERKTHQDKTVSTAQQMHYSYPCMFSCLHTRSRNVHVEGLSGRPHGVTIVHVFPLGVTRATTEEEGDDDESDEKDEEENAED